MEGPFNPALVDINSTKDPVGNVHSQPILRKSIQEAWNSSFRHFQGLSVLKFGELFRGRDSAARLWWILEETKI